MKFIIVFGIIITLISCTKKQDRLIAKKWKFEKIEKSVNGGPYVEESLDCKNDDIWTFEKDGSFSINSGSNCPSDQINGYWQIGADEKTISYTYNGFSGTYYDEIVELNKKQLVTIFDTGLIPTTYYKYYFIPFED